MVDGAFGATFDVTVGPVSTGPDNFKRAMIDRIRLSLPGLAFDEEYEVPVGRGYLRPDFVARFPGTPTVAMVADAKCRATIARRDVLKVAHYKAVTGAAKAALCHPRGAHITKGAHQASRDHGVDLVEG